MTREVPGVEFGVQNRSGGGVGAELFPYAAKYLDRPGGRLAYVDEGTGDPVVCVHGNPTWGFHFRAVVAALKADHRVIAVDHLGCGRSDQPAAGRYDYRLDSRIDDLEALIASLNLTRPVTLVVHDWGGMIGLGWAARHPARLGRLVAINTGAFPLPPGKRFPYSLWVGRNTRVGAWLIVRHNAFCRLAARWCVTRHALAPAVRAAYLAPHDTPARRRSVLRFVQTIPLTPADDGYATVTRTAAALAGFGHVPTLLLWGLKDFVFDPALFGRVPPPAAARRGPRVAGLRALPTGGRRAGVRGADPRLSGPAPAAGRVTPPACRPARTARPCPPTRSTSPTTWPGWPPPSRTGSPSTSRAATGATPPSRSPPCTPRRTRWRTDWARPG